MKEWCKVESTLEEEILKRKQEKVDLSYLCDFRSEPSPCRLKYEENDIHWEGDQH